MHAENTSIHHVYNKYYKKENWYKATAKITSIHSTNLSFPLIHMLKTLQFIAIYMYAAFVWLYQIWLIFRIDGKEL